MFYIISNNKIRLYMFNIQISDQEMEENSTEWVDTKNKWVDFQSLSLIVNWQVDFFTWEIESLIQENKSNWEKKEWNWKIDNINWKEIWKWWELKIIELLNWFKQTQTNNLWDLQSKNAIIECKTCEIWNGIVLREKQLNKINELLLENKYYTLLFYKKNRNWKMEVKKIFIFPVNIMVFIYNTLDTKRIQSNTWVFKRLHLWNTNKKYNEDRDWYKRREFKMWWIDIKIIEPINHSLDISKKAKEI